MIITAYNFHPNIDDKKHPILDDNLRHNFHPKTDDKKHPILDDNSSIIIIFIQKLTTRNIQYWMIMVELKFHPKTDDKKHPILDDYR